MELPVLKKRPPELELGSGELELPAVVERAAEAGATLAVSISGGKDSHALLSATTRLHAERGWPGRIYAVHADLGRGEWPETPAHVEKLAQDYGVELVVVRRTNGDLIDRIKDRRESVGPDKPFWPSPAGRYCTSDLKRGPIDRDLRTEPELVISVQGERALESDTRAKLPTVEVRKKITTKRLKKLPPDEALDAWLEDPTGRLGLDWHPLLPWSEADVWREIGPGLEDLNRRRALYAAGQEEEALEGWPAHPAYVYGNERLSCVVCLPFGSMNDLVNGARHNPDRIKPLLELERDSGWTFRENLSLEEVAARAGILDADPEKPEQTELNLEAA